MRTRTKAVLIVLIALVGVVLPFARARSPQSSSSPKDLADGTEQSSAEFYAAANSVLQTMSKILDLPVKSPLKESVRTKAQIRQYLVDEQNKEESPEKGTRTAGRLRPLA